METVMIILTGVLVTVATYLVLSKNIIQIILGTAVFTHANHLLIMIMGRLANENVPLLGESGEQYADALPQALILTSIVISFGVTAVFLVIAYRTYQMTNTDDLGDLRGFFYE
ncbi:MAG TPA: Na(+)/H(+) antiporter subunit C [Bacillota bacterium]|nr:Na(+)/H(+) antiporter subunit C [Bacillota bacterium]